MMESGDLEEAAELLRVLGHGVRLALLSSLIGSERSVGEIELDTGIGQPGLSQQLGVLRKAGLVLTRREAKLVYYRIDHDRIALVSGLLGRFAETAVAPKRGRDIYCTSGGSAATFVRMEPLRSR